MSFFNFDTSSFHNNSSNNNSDCNENKTNNNINNNTIQSPSSSWSHRSVQGDSSAGRSGNSAKNSTTSGGYLGGPMGMIGSILNRTTASTTSGNSSSSSDHSHTTRESNRDNSKAENTMHYNNTYSTNSGYSSSSFPSSYANNPNSPSARGRHYYHNNGSNIRTTNQHSSRLQGNNNRMSTQPSRQQQQQHPINSEKEMLSAETAAGAVPPLGVTAPTSFSFSPSMTFHKERLQHDNKRSRYLSFVSFHNPIHLHEQQQQQSSQSSSTTNHASNYHKNERRLCVLDLDPFWDILDANDNLNSDETSDNINDKNCYDNCLKFDPKRRRNDWKYDSKNGKHDTYSYEDSDENRIGSYKDDDMQISIDGSNDNDCNIPILNPKKVLKDHVRFLLNNENTNNNNAKTAPSPISKSNIKNRTSKRHSREKTVQPNCNIDSESESSLSFDERMRRERQRIYTGGVTQFSWGTYHSKNVKTIPETSINIDRDIDMNNNDNMRKVPTTPKRRTIMNNNVAPPTPELTRTKNKSQSTTKTTNNSQNSLRLLVPLRGNIYVQDGVGAGLRLVYDKTVLEYPKKGTRRRRQHRRDNYSGPAVAEDASAIDPQLSPDGSMVAFVVAGEIYVMSCDEVSDKVHSTTTTQGEKNQIDSQKNSQNVQSQSTGSNRPIRLTYGAINTDLNNYHSYHNNHYSEEYYSDEDEDYDSDENITSEINNKNRKPRYGKCITHGLADFVAQEEMDRYRGFWWDTSSSGILFTRVDESHVAPYRITHQGKDLGFGGASMERDGGNSATVHEDHRYPFAGETNPDVILGYIPIHTNDNNNNIGPSQARKNIASEDEALSNWAERIKWFPPPPEASEYLARVIWLPDGTACAQWQDRSQSTLLLIKINVFSGHTMTLHSEHSDVWINLHHMFKVLPRAIHPNECIPLNMTDINTQNEIPLNNTHVKSSASCEERDGAEETDFMQSFPEFPNILPDGSFSFLFASERTGFCHLYLYTYVPGHSKATLIRAVSHGNWMVESIVGLDMDNDVIYITGTHTSPLEQHLYVLPLVNEHRHFVEETNAITGHDNNANPNHNKMPWSRSYDNKQADESRVSRGLKQVINTLSGTVSSSASSKSTEVYRRRCRNDSNLLLSSMTHRYERPLVASSQFIHPLRLTVEPGVHNVIMDDSCRILVDTSSDLTRPPTTKVYALPLDGPFPYPQSSADEVSIQEKQKNNFEKTIEEGTTLSSSKTKFSQPLKLLFVIYDATSDEKTIQNSRANNFQSRTNKNDKNDVGLGSTMNDEFGYRVPELISFSTSDGTETLHAALFSPDKNIHGPGPYPLICSVYGGPHVQRVNRSWSQCVDMRVQRLCSLGFAVVKCDNRGSSRRGLAFESAIRKRLGRIEVLDQVAAVRQLVLMGVADPSRVGVYGWSYGGYLAAMCLCRAPDVFHVAIAGAPVTSWDGYDTHYTERYMGLPLDNRNGYNEAAVFDHIPNMRGKLMIVHGLIDENVHFRHTARLINRLIAAAKDYDLLIFPDERHSPRKLRDRIYMEKKISDYFIKNLLLEHDIKRNGATTYRAGNGFRRLAGHL